MKTLITLLAAFSLAGCALTAPLVHESEVAVKYKYIIVTVPDDLLTVPDQVPNIDTHTATDKDAGNWLVNSEARSLSVQSKLKAIKSYQDKKVEEVQKDLKIPKEDVIVK